MRFGNMPMAERRGLVVVQTEMHAKLYLAQRVGELEIGRRGVHGIAADDQQHVDLAGVHVGDEIPERGDLIDRLRFDRLRVDDGRARVAERGVHRVRENVDLRRLAVAGDDQARAAMRVQIFRDGVDPFLCGSPKGLRYACHPRSAPRPACPARPAHPGHERARDVDDFARLRGQTMIRARAGARGHRLDHVQAIHPIGLLGMAPCGEILRVAETARSAAEKVGVEGEDDVSPIEAVLLVDVLAEGELRAGTRAFAARRIPLMPFR